MTNNFLNAFSDPSKHQAETNFEPFPVVQVVNSEHEDKQGLFITKESAELAGFEPNDKWAKTKIRFRSSKEAVPGYIAQDISLTIIQGTELTMFRREQGKRDVLLGSYNVDIYKPGGKRDKNVVLKRRYLVAIRDAETKESLAERPFVLTTRGAFGSDFGQTYWKFRQEADEVYGGGAMNDYFHSFVTFSFTLEPELKGTPPEANFVATITGFQSPKAILEDLDNPTDEERQAAFAAAFAANNVEVITDWYERSVEFGWDNSDPLFNPKKSETEEALAAAAAATPAPEPVADNDEDDW
jgi:hypothetical protein